MIAQLGVIVPVANEADHLGSCLQHIADACARLLEVAPEITVRVVAVLDACHDASEQIAVAHGVEIVRVEARSVGSARRAGAGHLLHTHPAPELVWLANTDADSRVPRDWLTGMVEHADNGAHLLLGTVVPGPGLLPTIAVAWQTNHLLREGHPHIHGANFGIRGDVYLRLGGWPELTNGEDVALAELAESAGDLHIERTARLPVVTSTRLHARAPLGFSSYLRGLASGEVPVAVPVVGGAPVLVAAENGTLQPSDARDADHQPRPDDLDAEATAVADPYRQTVGSG